MKTLVKICGIKTKSAAKASVKYGADFLGFNFVFSSKRKIELKNAQDIIRFLGKDRPKTVAVFMDQPRDYIIKILFQIKFDLLQFHGNENPQFCQSFGLPYIKAFGVGTNTSVASLSKKMKKYRAEYFMLDRQSQGQGRTVDLQKVKLLAAKFSVILAGGLTPENVRQMIAKAGKIKAVDVAGGVETDGKKDLTKIRSFISRVKS